ncbi:hypothetical protein [Caulobacter mirabilis]|uniref:Tissue inhibitor of metalloproteinase n=1 Tax=Caulobacter mirabilis TaxID=69666 RepID=A0A2D2AT94_9CAUL|nr:hypothetical protein [Caulobacter mirabilis]ATQ41185.1 hypothetical protein CSW64_01540 [Caulobacter mirabilis]
MVRRLALVVAFALASAAAGEAAACSCARYETAEAQLAQTEVLFLAKAVGEDSFTNIHGIPQPMTRFEVVRTLKGSVAGVAPVAHVREEAFCGIQYAKGQTYLVAAYRFEGRLWTSGCSAPRFPLEDYERALGQGGQ